MSLPLPATGDVPPESSLLLVGSFCRIGSQLVKLDQNHLYHQEKTSPNPRTFALEKVLELEACTLTPTRGFLTLLGVPLPSALSPVASCGLDTMVTGPKSSPDRLADVSPCVADHACRAKREHTRAHRTPETLEMVIRHLLPLRA